MHSALKHVLVSSYTSIFFFFRPPETRYHLVSENVEEFDPDAEKLNTFYGNIRGEHQGFGKHLDHFIIFFQFGWHISCHSALVVLIPFKVVSILPFIAVSGIVLHLKQLTFCIIFGKNSFEISAAL